MRNLFTQTNINLALLGIVVVVASWQLVSYVSARNHASDTPAISLPVTSADTMSTTSSSTASSPRPQSSTEYGVWVWNSPVTMTSKKMDQVLSSAKATGFTVIYITIDDLLDYDTSMYTAALAAFVTKATASGIAVDAVAGATDWAKPQNRTKGYDMIDFVTTYNQTNPKLRGFQYDVEPYLLPEYEANKAAVLTDFVAFIDESATRLADSSLSFGVVIPHFYDSTQAWTPQVTYNGTTNYTFDHIRTILDRTPGNSIVVMAYRNFFAGANGIEELVAPEIAQSAITKVVVAQEVGDVEPSYVTFYGTSLATLKTVQASITDTFGTKPGYGGIAVHHLDPYLNLK